jgi:hypothetical protein
MIEDVNYKLIKGKRWLPFGRKYQLITPITHFSGDIIPIGFEWDGGSGVPMIFNDSSAAAFLDHDYAFGASGVGVLEANTQCLRRLRKDVGLWMASIISFWFILLTPALFGFFSAETSNKTIVRILATGVGIVNIIAALWFIYANVKQW